MCGAPLPGCRPGAFIPAPPPPVFGTANSLCLSRLPCPESKPHPSQDGLRQPFSWRPVMISSCRKTHTPAPCSSYLRG